MMYINLGGVTTALYIQQVTVLRKDTAMMTQPVLQLWTTEIL